MVYQSNVNFIYHMVEPRHSLHFPGSLIMFGNMPHCTQKVFGTRFLLSTGLENTVLYFASHNLTSIFGGKNVKRDCCGVFLDKFNSQKNTNEISLPGISILIHYHKDT